MLSPILTLLLWACCLAIICAFGPAVQLKSIIKPYHRITSYLKTRLKAWNFLLKGPELIKDGYMKAGGNAFRIAGPDHNYVFVSSEKHMSEIRKATRDVLSMFGATKQMFQPAYTMLGHNWHDERGAEGIGYVRAVGTLFPRQLLNIMPEMHEVVRDTFGTVAKSFWQSEGHGTLPAYELNKKILCQLNGFCFFGDELAKNELFMEKIFQYNELVIMTGEVLRLVPDFVKRTVGPYIGRHTSIQNHVFNMLYDVVARRMEAMKLENTSLKRPNDMVQWIIDTAPPGLNWGPRRVSYEIIAIWFGSVHALAATVTYVLFDLCEHPEYLEPLRTELDSPEFESFMKTTKGLPLLDSFIKESSRLSPIEAVAGRRQALKDFTFSDGTQVRKGDWTCVPAMQMLHDETYFPQASTFEGFRFAPRDRIPKDWQTVFQPEGPSRYSDLSANYHAWGIGSIVCPGRFYASIATKLIIAHVIKNFDCSITSCHKTKSSVWRTYILPKDDVFVQFSPRQSRTI